MMMGCTSSLCVTSSHLTHNNSTWSLVSLSCRDDEIINCASHLAICSSSTHENITGLQLLWRRWIIQSVCSALFWPSHHFTHKLNYHWRQENSTELGLFDSNVYTILMVSRQAVVPASLTILTDFSETVSLSKYKTRLPQSPWLKSLFLLL